MSDLLERLRQRGWRLTPQRRVVAEVLHGSHVHLTADEVLTRAQQRLPEVSRATVYNTLGDLVALGEVHEMSFDGRTKRYDPNVEGPHHHLVCDGCGTAWDVLHDVLAPDLPAAERHGVEVRDATVTYRGLCETCRDVGGALSR